MVIENQLTSNYYATPKFANTGNLRQPHEAFALLVNKEL
jgi:hypothetical protein